MNRYLWMLLICLLWLVQGHGQLTPAPCRFTWGQQWTFDRLNDTATVVYGGVSITGLSTDNNGNIYTTATYRHHINLGDTIYRNPQPWIPRTLLVKMDTLGNRKWVREFTGVLLATLANDDAGDLYWCGNYVDSAVVEGQVLRIDTTFGSAGTPRFIAMKFDPEGRLLHIVRDSTSGYSYVKRMVMTDQGKVGLWVYAPYSISVGGLSYPSTWNMRMFLTMDSTLQVNSLFPVYRLNDSIGAHPTGPDIFWKNDTLMMLLTADSTCMVSDSVIPIVKKQLLLITLSATGTVDAVDTIGISSDSNEYLILRFGTNYNSNNASYQGLILIPAGGSLFGRYFPPPETMHLVIK